MFRPCLLEERKVPDVRVRRLIAVEDALCASCPNCGEWATLKQATVGSTFSARCELCDYRINVDESTIRERFGDRFHRRSRLSGLYRGTWRIAAPVARRFVPCKKVRRHAR